MKILKALGITLLSSGIAVGCAWTYNEIKREKMNKELWESVYDTKSHKDSLKLEGNVRKAYFEASQIIKDSIANIDTVKTIKKYH